MIIDDLCHEYDVLVSKNQAPVYGYDNINAPYGLAINDDGTLIAVHPLGDFSGKKPRNIISVPARVTRSSGIASNFLCDTVAYMLGYDAKGKPERAARSFKACGELHHLILKGVKEPAAVAVCKFFEREAQWETARRLMGDMVWETALSMNFVLQYSDGLHTEFVGDVVSVKEAWDSYYNREDQNDSETITSLVSGKKIIPEKTHPKIKGVVGAQSSGASLISFNAPAFCSRGAEQNENAPMSKREAYEYTTALNALLRDQDRVQRLGDDTIVSWARCGETAYPDLFGHLQGHKSNGLNESTIKAAMSSLAQGHPYDYGGIHLRPDEEFHVLALTPNAARLSVRFYLTNSFGEFARNIEQHYRDTEILRPDRDMTIFLPTWRLLNQTIRQQNKNVKVSTELAGAVMKAILNGTAYPVTLINAVERRINAERDISPDKAAIIKAYYLRKTTNEKFKEVLQMNINTESDYLPYVLGRLFSVYEQIQLAAIPSIKTTIKDRYFTAAAATPARIFPILGRLEVPHMRKSWEYEGQKKNLAMLRDELAEKIGDRYPVRLTLEEQGAFQLGYYFENQRRFIKKNKNVDKNIDNNGQGADHD
ncbi:type I-C CRISPR-associated protein Cas8c/Csd1 [Bifidobacterium simiarum]|uniref:Type I-C CRISPR-associated protein Cas8c/Csd1 n=1 Tax=Bifidobacterium simiarum TaxID=2045441 RepID=A0A2M9HEA9_9BIFI|nr:type I-C CRISPR-associated protein Cas8c/Csd1 [Bifidobacterium simiarum]PJM75148.1 type I-C CRISPR-associated protein Cas8c/Csd1 [Bifidobacterium simiarum]